MTIDGVKMGGIGGLGFSRGTGVKPAVNFLPGPLQDPVARFSCFMTSWPLIGDRVTFR